MDLLQHLMVGTVSVLEKFTKHFVKKEKSTVDYEATIKKNWLVYIYQQGCLQSLSRFPRVLTELKRSNHLPKYLLLY